MTKDSAFMTICDLFSYCNQMLSEQWGYIMGKSGQVWTARQQNNSDRKQTKLYGQKWIGHKVTDCSGVIVYIWKQYGLTIEHSANVIAKKHCGEMTDVPQPGYAAFLRSNNNYHHIGIVDETGKWIYEARSTFYGFVHNRRTDEFDCFAPFKDVDYEEKINIEYSGESYAATVNSGRRKLYVMIGPGYQFRSIYSLTHGTKVFVLGSNNNWAVIKYGDKYGYVDPQFLIRDENQNQIQP